MPPVPRSVRVTHAISRRAGATLLQSVRTAAAIGRPLNTYVTIALWQLGLTPDDASAVFQQLLSRHFVRWSGYQPRGAAVTRNGAPTYAWVIEAVEHGYAHVHWMLYVTPVRRSEFERKIEAWIKRRFPGQDLEDNLIRVITPHNAEGLKLYLAKGLDPHLARAWNIEAVDTGRIVGKRVGVSLNLGPSEWRPRKAAYKAARLRATAA